MYDIVYPLKAHEPNLDLIYSLRSLEKFGGEFGRVFVVGHKPAHITNITFIERVQVLDRYCNTRENINAVCECSEVSEKFVYFNDDFILTKKVEDWDEFCSCYMGTLMERSRRFDLENKTSKWRDSFYFNAQLLRKLGISEGLDFEYHGPFIFEKQKLQNMYQLEKVKPYAHVSTPLIFKRSLYGNIYPTGRKLRKIEDYKYTEDIQNFSELAINGFFSVGDQIIGNENKCPNLNVWLKNNFPDKSKFEE